MKISSWLSQLGVSCGYLAELQCFLCSLLRGSLNWISLRVRNCYSYSHYCIADRLQTWCMSNRCMSKHMSCYAKENGAVAVNQETVNLCQLSPEWYMKDLHGCLCMWLPVVIHLLRNACSNLNELHTHGVNKGQWHYWRWNNDCYCNSKACTTSWFDQVITLLLQLAGRHEVCIAILSSIFQGRGSWYFC